MQTIGIIILVSILGPIIGSFIGVIKKPKDIFIYNMLSFASGVMLSISFLQLIPESLKFSSIWVCIIGITIGSLIMYAIDRIIPHIHPQLGAQEHGKNIEKTAIFLIIGMFIHHLPEGMAVAIGSVDSFKFSLTIALAIAIHDIPEGISTASTYYYSSNNRLKAFVISALTTVPTIIGFLIAYILYQNLSNNLIGLISASTAGFMIYICGDELIPSSCGKSINHSTIFSLILGVLVVISLSQI